ncbi:MAG: hypothetical protein FJ318_03805 [SAR202 cluster bacterium]|nr:hypothetical protein [SAR202 cluster bacterium]
MRATAAQQRIGARIGGILWREAAMPAAFIIAILASNYVLASIPNVKFFDLLVFIAGYSLGLRRGVVVAGGAWLVYGTFNPFGPATPALLVVLMAAEAVYAAVGSLARRVLPPDRIRLASPRTAITLAAAAVASTLVYDLVTNVYTGLVWAGLAPGRPLAHWIVVALSNPGAIWFAFAHLTGNVTFFTVLGPVLMRGADRARSRLGW